MSEEMKETKCCGCCGNKELNNEELEKVTGGGYWQGDKYICPEHIRLGQNCTRYATIDGVAYVCTCVGKTNGRCCKDLGNKCNCAFWDKNGHKCRNVV